MATHIARRDLIRTAWLQAIAYANSSARSRIRKHPRAWAVAAFPSLLFAHCIIGHRNFYLTRRRQGVVCLYQSPPWGLFFRGATSIALLYAALSIEAPLADGIVGAVALLVLASTLTSLIVTGRRPKAPRGTAKIAKPRDHYVIGLIAAHPDAPRTEALLFARGLVRRLPPGSTVVVHPRTAELRTSYEGFGFEPSKGLEMIARMGGESR